MSNNDFSPETAAVWIDNWKRGDLIGRVSEAWLNTFPVSEINVITNHSSVTIDNFPNSIRNRIKIWPNVLRFDDARGPINRNINQSYVHSFLSGKKYVVFLHDSYVPKPGWDKVIANSEYDLYLAPQGDGFHVISLEGLRTFGWWDERYATMGWHEIDYICRALRKSYVLKEGRCSLVDIHGLWPLGLDCVRSGTHHLFYNSVGLENYIQRLDKNHVPQIGPQLSQRWYDLAESWHKKKWAKPFDNTRGLAHGEGTRYNLFNGPIEQEIDWYPWLDINTLQIAGCAY